MMRPSPQSWSRPPARPGGLRSSPPPVTPPSPEPPPRSRWTERLDKLRTLVGRSALFGGGVLAALAAILIYRILFPRPHVLTPNEVSTQVAQAMASATPQPSYSDLVYQIIQPSIVLIQSKNDSGEESLGSGVIISDQGLILTALHVVDGATEIQVTYADGTQSTAQITTAQTDDDIAVLQPDQLPSKVVPAVLGNPNAMRVGDEAYAVGNPFGLYSSMSAGVISGFGRSFQPENTDRTLRGLIQIDAAVNPGNSGGPLLNRAGQVIGIITGIANPTKEDVFIGIGFAVPITTAASAFGSPVY
jgi:S1-C subfamily serine protease